MFPEKWVPWECLANLYLLLYAAVMIGAAMIAYRRPAARVDRGGPDAGQPPLGSDLEHPRHRRWGPLVGSRSSGRRAVAGSCTGLGFPDGSAAGR